jgi:hypothetical protein
MTEKTKEIVTMEFEGKTINVEVTTFKPNLQRQKQVETFEKDLLGGYKREDLLAAFNAVQDKEHWKNPINAEVPEGMDREMLAYAIWFFTSSVCRFSKRKGVTRVKAAGYFAAVGA